MTGAERIVNTLRGEPTDRAPVWLLDPFANDMVIDAWTEQWMRDDPLFRDLQQYYWEKCELIFEYKSISPYGVCNRVMATPPRYITVENEEITEEAGKTSKTITYRIDTPKGPLHFKERWQKNIATPWRIEYPLESIEDAEKLLSIDGTQDEIDFSDFFKIQKRIGDKGVMMVLINTPMVTVSSAFRFEDFLIYSKTEPELIMEMTETAFLRVEAVLEQCIDAGLGPIFRLMGSEQSTPPMNSLDKYRGLVYNYEKQLIEMIHDAGCFAAVHCHGNIREALPLMLDAGVDMLDPVEAPPSGDITFSEAKQAAGHQITLAGNIQYDDLNRRTPEEIRRQVEALFSDGKKDHVMVSCTGYPITTISRELYDNYIALIDASLEYGKM